MIVDVGSTLELYGKYTYTWVIVAESDFGLGTRKQDLVKLFKTKIIPKKNQLI